MIDTKDFFEYLYKKYNTKDYIHTDPILFPHTYTDNIEYTAFTASLFAYGNVTAMQKFLRRLFEECGTDPFNLKENTKGLKYRFQSAQDVESYLLIMKKLYSEYGSLENFFNNKLNNPLEAAKYAMIDIHKKYITDKTRGLNFLFTIPGKSASKRLYMFLRWMIRKDDIDFGLWTKFNKQYLSIPLDTHIKNICTKLSVIKQTDSDFIALEKANAYFVKLNLEDPVKYDFSLTRLGITEKCKYISSTLCNQCSCKKRCLFN